MKYVIKFNNREEYEYIESILLKNGFKWVGNDEFQKHPYENICLLHNSMVTVNIKEIGYLLIQDKLIYFLSHTRYIKDYIIIDIENLDSSIEAFKMNLI